MKTPTSIPRIDDLLPHSSFRLDGETYTITRIENGVVWCENEDGGVSAFSGHLHADEWNPAKNWFRNLIP